MRDYIKPIENPSDVPSAAHFAILTFDLIYSESHGESIGNRISRYTVYPTKERWEAEITRLKIDKKDFVPLVVAAQPQVTMEVKVKIQS